MSEDPIGFDGGDTNIYRYTHNQPIGFKDPYGNTPVSAGVGAAVGAAVGAFSGYYNSSACSIIGKIGDSVLGAMTGAVSGGLAGMGFNTGGFIATTAATVGGMAAGLGPAALDIWGPSFGGHGCNPPPPPNCNKDKK